ncbi:MAG: selenocysteine-specific translation elongation factor [candidate division Zixibacteria bacterium RBG_16_48_11]|nr:MAG: selenocysteine-specific translation elongation factor [candidate division Zixibacteria bacterium RBG_16_48_11]
MFVIGTAGHVDHGKSSLVRVLTGIDPDRLPEEKAREMTIDLGFAWLSLDDGQEVGIVDVPGHERFIRNMIAGAGAVNAVLFVVAADDGWMPQSQEHLDILNLLQIKHGIIVLNKIDIIESDWLNMVEQEIRKKVSGSFLAQASLVRVSSTAGTGIAELKPAIKEMLSKMELPGDVGKPRLYIDRVFTMAGRGTVITGTLTSGKFKVNQEIEILPKNSKAKIREMQTHKKMINEALPGNRVAMNLSGVEKEILKRGDVILNSEQDEPVSVLYVNLQLLPQIQWGLKKQILLQVMLGSAEVLGRTTLLDRKELNCGEEGLIEIRLNEPLVPRLFDRVVLRLPGPQLTVGGGPILGWAIGDKKLTRDKLIPMLKERKPSDLPSLLLSEVKMIGLAKSAGLLKSSHYSQLEIDTAINQLLNDRKLFRQGEFLCHQDTWQQTNREITELLESYHQQYPFKPGLKTTELAGRLPADPDLTQVLVNRLLSEGKLTVNQGYVALVSHKPKLTPALEKKMQTLTKILESNASTPPGREELIRQDPDFDLVVTYLIQIGELIELRDGFLIRTSDFQIIQDKVRTLLSQKGQISVSDAREYLQTTRKYAVPILEKLDQLGITKRKGDYRILNED